MGAACQRVLDKGIKHSQAYRMFQKWKLATFAMKHGLQPLVTTHVRHIEYQMSNASLLSEQNKRDTATKVMMSAFMRHKSRRLCKMFWVWHQATAKGPVRSPRTILQD
jgi:hypothetical protein